MLYIWIWQTVLHLISYCPILALSAAASSALKLCKYLLTNNGKAREHRKRVLLIKRTLPYVYLNIYPVSFQQ